MRGSDSGRNYKTVMRKRSGWRSALVAFCGHRGFIQMTVNSNDCLDVETLFDKECKDHV